MDQKNNENGENEQKNREGNGGKEEMKGNQMELRQRWKGTEEE